MRKTLRALATLAVASAAIVSTAQAQTIYTGDLILGFTSQSGNDFMYDLGQASALGSTSIDLSSALAGFNLTTVKWGIIGDKSVSGTRTAWTTTGGTPPNTINGNASWANLDTATKSIFQNFPATGAGQTLTIAATDDNSWNQQTVNGAISSQYRNAYEDPNVTGLGSATLFKLITDNSPGLNIGTFTLNSGGTLNFTAVPEPSSYGLVAGAGLLALSFRRFVARRA